MDLMDFASEICAGNQFVKVSLGGFAGSGKTRTASEFIAGVYNEIDLKKPLLFIDNEKGSRFLIPFFKKHGIKTLVKETVHLADVLWAMKYLEEGQIDFLFIDSLTKVWYQFCKDYKKANHKKFLTLNDWGKIIPEWQHRFNDKFVNVEGNFMFTGRGGYEYDLEEDENTHKKTFVKSGVKMKLAGETSFEPDLNVWMQLRQEIVDGRPHQWREAQILKDRSGFIDGAIFKNPTFDDFKPFLDFILSVETGVVAKETDTSNLVPEEFSSDRNKKKILLEKIYGTIENKYPGTKKENKEAKVKIKKEVFNTYSDTEIELSTIAELETGYNKILDLLVVEEKDLPFD
jgi:hypothetical protein